jgi:hypothetical protein
LNDKCSEFVEASFFRDVLFIGYRRLLKLFGEPSGTEGVLGGGLIAAIVFTLHFLHKL